MNLKKILPFSGALINVIIETPKSSRNKFDYDFKLKVFKLNKTLPSGMIFPFDFGFIPNTKAEDGDPVDVLVLMDQKAYPGCLVECRIIAALEAIQTERDKSKMRNDRIVAVSDCSVIYDSVKKMRDLNKDLAKQIEEFFINYNNQAGKSYKPLKWVNAAAAGKLIKTKIER